MNAYLWEPVMWLAANSLVVCVAGMVGGCALITLGVLVCRWTRAGAR